VLWNYWILKIIKLQDADADDVAILLDDNSDHHFKPLDDPDQRETETRNDGVIEIKTFL